MLKSEYGQTSEFNEIDTTSPDILIDILNVRSISPKGLKRLAKRGGDRDAVIESSA